MRISTSQIYSQSLSQMNSSLSNLSELNMMSSSQKQVNRPSDDPTGMGTIIDLRAYNSTLSGYTDNCETADSYLSLADEALSSASETITAAEELAEQGSTDTYTDEDLEAMAIEMASYLDTLLSIANSKYGSDDYLFAGDDTSSSPYEMGLGVTTTDDTFDGVDISLTGELDSTIAVRFDDSGTIGGAADLGYSYSTDGGETWTSATLTAGDTTLDLGSVQMDIESGTAVTATTDDDDGSLFYVREAVVYTGSDKAMSVDISESADVDMTTVGSDIFGGVDGATGQAYDEPNLFETISDCIVYMENGDQDGVAECLERLNTAHENVETEAADIGARENKVTYVESSISAISTLTTNNISSIEDADAAQLVVELEEASYVYEAVLSSTSTILDMSLLDYI